MVLRMAACASFVILLSNSASFATDASGKFNTKSSFSCAGFVQQYASEVVARKGPNAQAGYINNPQFAPQYFFIVGWISANNTITPDTIDILPDGIESELLWLNNYCKAHASDSVDNALESLVVEAYPKRRH
jgi:hypothetical protein